MPRRAWWKKITLSRGVGGAQRGKLSPAFTYSDMRGVLSFFGVFLSVLSDASLRESGFVSEFGCGNKTSNCNSISSFCEQMLYTRMECYSLLYEYNCFMPFKEYMESFNHTDWCNWENVKRMYNNFTLCTENIAESLKIPWPNWMVENRFVEIHAAFFRDCPSEELQDPAPSIVFALVMAPICLIPVMVVLVVLKTKNGDGSS